MFNMLIFVLFLRHSLQLGFKEWESYKDSRFTNYSDINEIQEEELLLGNKKKFIFNFKSYMKI